MTISQNRNAVVYPDVLDVATIMGNDTMITRSLLPARDSVGFSAMVGTEENEMHLPARHNP